MDPFHIVLVGLPGVGKTTVGKLLAEALDRPFIDLDDEIERLFGKNVAEIFAEDGEEAFREAEARASVALAARPGGVVAPGGGWIMNPDAVAPLRPVARIIYLRVSPAEALRRMGRGVERRPLFAAGAPAAIIHGLYDRRRGWYEAESSVVIDTEGLTPEEVAARVVETISGA